MIPIFLAAIAAAAGQPAGTSIKLFEDEVETSYLDIEKGERAGVERLVWITHDYRKQRADGMKYARDQWSINCARRTFSIFAVVEYGGGGTVLSVQAIPFAERRPMAIPSGGRMEAVFNAVCG